jgi:cyclohexanone monooxygenase
MGISRGSNLTSPHDKLEIDFETLRARYAEEREKRFRSDALGQYQPLAGRFADFADDPNADPDFTREPVDRDTDVLIIGAGFGGLLAGAHLRQAGVRDTMFVDRAGDFGGTWYWNRYPGVRCDVESCVYIPLLEETGYIPTEKYAGGGEILEHCRRIARHYDLNEGALFQTEAQAVRWDEARQRWLVSTDRGDRIAARFVVSCTGHYSKPKLPGIPGIETFAGHSFHTSRWDYDYTGGDERGGLTGLAGKTVGVIGTGSTGIQCAPPLAEAADHLYIFQRTPCSVDVRGNRPIEAGFGASLEPGWQRGRMRNFTLWTSGVQDGEDLVCDGWTNLLGEPTAVTGGAVAAVDPEEMLRAEMLKMEKVRQRIDAVVEDRATAEALKPYYHYFCKRPGFSDDYLQIFNRDNVTLVDSGGQGVERITSKGVVVAGKEYEVDCLVYATGFDFMTGYARETGLDITGRGGRSLSEHWRRGARTLYGMQTRGFPNFFLMSLIQSGISINYMHIADEQTQLIAQIIAHCLANGVASVEPSEAAENEWVDKVVALGGPRRAFLESCTPSYFNYEGQKQEQLELNEPYGGGVIDYLNILEQWRRDGSFKGLEMRELAKDA